MKYLKRYDQLNESNEIYFICEKYGLESYHINSDGSVDVDGDVKLINKGLTKLPLKFGRVTGNFNCSKNQLTTLEGSPKWVGCSFFCSMNKLTSLEGAPSEVGGNFNCSNNQLISLEGSPIRVVGHFDCNGNQLITLIGSTQEIGGYFDCNFNKLITLNGCPEAESYFEENPVNVIWRLFKKNNNFIKKINHIYTDLWIGDGWTIQGDVMEQIADELGITLPTDWQDSVEEAGYNII